MTHYSINTAFGQKTCFSVMKWQVTIFLYSCVASQTKLKLKDISLLVKSNKVEQIGDFSRKMLQKSQKLFPSLPQKRCLWIALIA